MTGIIDSLKALVKTDVPVAAPVEEYPIEQAPGYWVDNSQSNGEPAYVVPSHITTPDTFRPTVEHNVPYRGVVDHGVETDEPSILVGPMPQELAEERRAAAVKEARANEREEIFIAPIPVTVVDMPTPTATDNRMATAAFEVGNAVPVQIAPRRQQRNKLTIATAAGAVILIGDTSEVLIGGQGYSIPAGGQYETKTTGDVWALMTVAGPTTVRTIEEFSVRVGESES